MERLCDFIADNIEIIFWGFMIVFWICVLFCAGFSCGADFKNIEWTQKCLEQGVLKWSIDEKTGKRELIWVNQEPN